MNDKNWVAKIMTRRGRVVATAIPEQKNGYFTATFTELDMKKIKANQNLTLVVEQTQIKVDKKITVKLE